MNEYTSDRLGVSCDGLQVWSYPVQILHLVVLSFKQLTCIQRHAASRHDWRADEISSTSVPLT